MNVIILCVDHDFHNLIECVLLVASSQINESKQKGIGGRKRLNIQQRISKERKEKEKDGRSIETHISYNYKVIIFFDT